ncbi:MAG: hypothetical protein AWT59_1996 [Candidatus Gallionella acididurans]|uniref:Uncharacterized protein n=1 Tax=Candidatus Gallionella acididurans TaxID=1796491 RepID=A0A139BS90_9PROT|nr:MAG: hypothetical protein AWT59_1996 [Candidatus Gallionella acididurans]
MFGMRGECIFLIPAKASDALGAVQVARHGSAMQAKDFKPLEVCQAHPVTKEFDALFQITVNRIKALAGSAPTVRGQC